MRKIIVKVDPAKSAYLEKLNYELNFVKDIIQRLIESHPNNTGIIQSGAFKSYQKRGVELQAEYNIASAELGNEYVPSALKGHQYNWNIPANSDEMTINILCSCHIEGIEDV